MALSKEDLDLLNAPASPSLFGSAPAQSSRDDLFAYAQQTADELGIPRDIANRLIKTESGGNPDAVSPKGAFGPAQLMPPTAKYLEQRYGGNAADPRDNIRLGMSYLKENYDRFGDWRLAAAAYHAGPGAVEKAGGVPPGGDGKTSTADYSSTVAGTMKSVASSMGNGADLLPPSRPARTTMADMSAATAPGIAAAPPEGSAPSPFSAGAKQVLPQTKRAAGALLRMFGDEFSVETAQKIGDSLYNSGSDELSKIAHPAADLRNVLDGKVGIGEYFGYWSGYGVGQIAESAIVASAAGLVGAAAGSAVPGAGTAIGGVTGFIGGLFGKTAAKEAILSVGNAALKKAIASGATAEVANLAKEQAIKQATKAYGVKAIGGLAAAAGQEVNNFALEAGEIYGHYIDEAQKKGGQVSQEDRDKAFWHTLAASSMETVSDLAGIGQFLKEGKKLGAGFSGLAKTVGKETVIGLAREVPTEVIQTYFERRGEGKSTTDDEAMWDYANAAGGATIMGGGAGMVTGTHAHLFNKEKEEALPKPKPNSPISNAVAAAGPAPVTPGAGVPPAGGATPSDPADPFTSDPGIAPRLAAIDALLSNRDLLGSLRAQQPDMVDQALYVRNAMVGNPDLPVRTRLNALDHLEATLQSVPDFTMGNNGEPPSAPGTSIAPVAGGELAPVRPVQGGAMDIPGRVIDGESSRVDGSTDQPTLPRQMLPRQALSGPVDPIDSAAGNGQSALPAPSEPGAGQPPGKSDVPGATKALNQSRAGFDTIRHMIGQGFTGISQGANGWQLVHPKTGQTFPLKTPAEVQVARVAVNNQINDAAHQAATSDQNDKPQPSEAQKKAGNYAKGHVDWNGFDVSIENPKGSKRSGIDPGGKPWSVDMPGHYGYFKNTLGKDGDQVDLYLGGTPHSDHVFVVDQIDANSRAFDEHKVIGNVRNEDEAKALYDAGFSDGKGPQRRGAITKMSMDEFRNWLKNEDTTKPVAYKKAEEAPSAGKDMTAADEAATSTSDLPIGGETSTPEAPAAEGKEASHAWIRKEIESLIFLKAAARQHDKGRSIDKLIALLKRYMDGEDVKPGKIQSFIPEFKAVPKAQEIVQGIYDHIKAESNKAAAESRKKAKEKRREEGETPPAYSRELGSQAPDNGMQERPEVRADESGSLAEPAQSRNQGGAGGREANPNDIQAAAQAFRDSQPIDKYEYDRNLKYMVDEIQKSWANGSSDEYSRRFGPDEIHAQLKQENASEYYDEDGDITDVGNDRYNELERALSNEIAREHLGEPQRKEVDFSRPLHMAEFLHDYLDKNGYWVSAIGGSGKSDSKYFDIKIGGKNRTLRISDHPLPPEYGSSDIELPLYDRTGDVRFDGREESDGISQEEAIRRAGDLVNELSKVETKKAPDDAGDAAKKAAAIENQFSGNKVFTADKVAAARERMKKKLGTLNSGLDPEMMIDGMTIAGAYIESGIRNFGAYARAMVSDFGDGIKPYLLSFYEGARHYPGIEKDGMSSAEEAAATYQDMMEPAEQSFEHAGFRIYPINYGGAPGWAVQTIDNVGTDRVFGDTLHRDVEEAKKEAERQAKRVEERKEIDAKEAEEKAASEAKKEANRGLTITQRRANAALDKQTKLPVNAGVGRGTRREAMESAVRNDRLISMVMIYDSSAYKQDEDEQGRLRRAGYSVFGNDQHPSKKRYDELAAKMKDRSNYQKPEYRLYSGRSTDDSFWEISKTEYDYARQLEAERKEAPQESPKEIEPVHAADLTNRVTVSDNLRNGDIVVDGDGRHYIKVEKLHNYIEVAPIVDGKPVVYAGSLIRFTLDDISRANNPDARHDALIKTGDNWYDLDQKSKNSEAATAVHVEAGKVEPATAAVISASVAKSAKATPMNSEQAREWLLGEIDKAILGAEAKNNKEWNDAVEGAGKDYKREDFYVVFDVPGDGKFSVRNNIERLKEFKKEVMASAGFKKPRSRPMSYSPSQAKTSVRDMLDDGELMLAVDYGALTDKPVMFGAKNGDQAIIYTDVDDVDLDGFSLKIGREWLPDLKRLNWAVIEQNTGLSFASGKTREAALSKANSILDEPANVEKLNNAIAQAEKVSQEDLKKRWTDWAMSVESGEEAKRIAKEKQDKADAALWEALFPERKEQFHAHYTDADLMMEQAYRAGKGNEFLSAMSRQSANAQAFITEARTALNKLIKSNGGKEAPDTPVDYKGWQRTPTGNGAFTLKSGNIVVRAEPRLNGLYQAFFGSGKSGPRMTEQDVVDWAVTLKEDFSGAPEEKKYSGPADVSSKEGQHELADRAGVIASLTLMNEQIRKLNPDAAWHDSQIADARDLDALRIQISDALMVAQRGETPEVGADLRKMLNDLSGEELKEAFRLLNLAGSRLTASERVDMLMSENHNEVWQALDAMGIKKPGAEAPATAESGKHFESVDALNALTNPVENSDWIKLTNGEEWQARQGYSGMGWSLVKDGKTHPMATNIDGQSQFIRAIIEADAKAEKSESPQKSKVPNPDANFVDSVSGEHVSLTDAQRDFLRTTKKREQENIDAGKSVGEVSLFAFDGSIYLAITRPGGSEWNVARLEDDGRVTGAKEGTHNGLMGFGFDDRRVNLIPESEFKKSKAEAAQRSQEWSDKAAEEAKPTWYSYKGINSTFPRSLIKMNGKWYRVGTDNKLLRIGRRNGDWTILDAISNNPGEWEAGDKVNVDANGVFSPVKDEEQADANTFTEAEALKRTAWRDMGTQGGIRTYVLEFFDSEGNIETGRGAMRHSYIEQSVGKGGDKKYRVYSRDGSYIDPAYDSLRIAKKAGEGASLESIKAEGYIRESAIDKALRSVGIDPNAPVDKAKQLRRDAEKLQNEARAMLAGIPAGQPVGSIRDVNLREKAAEKSRKAGAMFKEADRLDAEKVDAGDTVTAEENSAVESAPIHSQKEPAEKPKGTYTLAEHEELMSRINGGEATVEEYQSAFARLKESKEAITEELSKLTKEQLMKVGNLPYHYRSDTKDTLVRAAGLNLLEDFDLRETRSYVMGNIEGTLTDVVAKATPETLSDFHFRRTRAINEFLSERQKRNEGIENPRTLEDFHNIMRAGKKRAELTEEQKALWDELQAAADTDWIESDKERKAAQPVTVAAQTTEGRIVENRHTKTGEELFTVQGSERVAPEVFSQWKVTAKGLDGYYSSFKGNGAVPGWIFKKRENAEAFLKYIGGDVEEVKQAIAEQKESDKDDASQSTVERLNSMADKMIDKADESLGRDRRTNTARQSRLANGAEREANSLKALAETMQNIARRISDGSIKHLKNLRTRAQVEMLRDFVTRGHSNWARSQTDNYGKQQDLEASPVTSEAAEYAEFPYYMASVETLSQIAAKLAGKPGAKLVAARIAKFVEAVQDKAYAEAVNESPLKFALFKKDSMEPAIFGTEAEAKRSARFSGLADSTEVKSIGRGKHVVVIDRQTAINQKRYVPKAVGNLRIAPEQAEEMLAKVAVFNRTASRWDQINNLWWLDTVKERRSRLKAMGIETPAQFRSALREFIGLREAPKELDKAKELERALIGQKNVGVDFFPTPVSVAQDMVDRAGIEEGMAVLEPSAGNGNIAEAIREAGAEPDVAEISGQLRDILEAKGFSVIRNDFTNIKPREGYTYGDLFQHKDGRKGIMRGSGGMGSGRVGFVPEGKTGREFEWVDRDDLTGIRHLGDSSGYDRIVMNPPFSNNLDIQHVRHAYDLLRPGGRIVAIVGEGAFTRSGKTETEFRAWMDAMGAEVEELPANTFKSSELLSKTGANARMVVIDKPAGDGVVASTAANAVPMEDWLSVRVLTEVAGEAFKKLGHYPTLKILDTPEDAGVATGDRTFSGFVRNQIIHLVRNGIASRDEAIDTVWHELFHYGLRRFMTREQYIADMNKLYGRDAFLKLKADAWIKNDPVAKKLRDAGESEDYIKARGADEALAWFAESIRGNQEFRNSGLKGKAIRTITRWLAEIADFFGANRVASQIRAYTNEEARRYVMSVFGKFNDDSVEVLAWDGDKPTFMTAGNDRDRSREESLKRNADEIRAMDPDVRDDTEFQSFPGGYHAHNLYEAQNLLPKPSDKLKRVTENNTNTLYQDYDYIANVDGEHFGISKYEDPDEPDDDAKFIYAFQPLTDQGSRMTETVTDDKDELFKEMRAALSGMESRGETAAITGALPEAIRKAFVKAFGERSIRQLEARGLAHIVPSAADLPPGIDISPTAKAVFQNNQAWFIADRMVPEAAHREMLHEIGEHYGLERMLGVEGYDSLLQRVKDLRDQGDAHTVAAWNTVLKSYPNEVPGSRRFMHEVLAQLGQNADIQARPWWKQIIEAVKRFLIRQGFTGMIRHGDIQDMVLHSLKMAAKPLPTGPGGGIRHLDSANAQTMYSRESGARDTATRRLGKFVDAFLAGHVSDQDTQLLGDTPYVLQALGAAPLQMQIDGQTIKKVIGDKHKYFITADMLKQIPEHLYDPLAVFDSPDPRTGLPGKLLVTELSDQINGEPVIVAVHLNKQSNRYVINEISGIYAAHRDTQKKKLTAEAIEYYRNEKSLEQSTTPSLDISLRDVVQSAQDSGRTVLSEDDVVNKFGALHSNPAPVFYSALANTVPAMAKIADKSGMVSPTAAKAWLLARQKEGKFKSDELNWSGLLDWLDMKNNAPVFGPGFGVIEEYQNEDGKWEQVDDLGSYHRTRAEAEAAIKTLPTPKSEDGALNRLAVREWPSIDLGKRGEKVAVADIEAFVRDNGVQVKEVMLGDSGPSFDAAVEEKLNEQIRGIADDANNDYWYQTLNDESERNGQEWIELSTRERKQLLESLYSPEDRFSMVSSDLASDMEQEIRDEMRDGFAEENHVATKFDDYQLPGGENYRELLLTLPEKSKKETWEWFDPETQESKQGFSTQQEAYDDRPNIGAVVNRVEAADSPQNFRSAHFDQPNILAHVRFNERVAKSYTDDQMVALGERLSDWYSERAGKKVDVSSFGSGITSLAKKEGIITPLEAAQYSHYRGFNNDTNGAVSNVLFIEELQSDFGQSYRNQTKEIAKAVDSDFTGIIERMKKDGVLTVECD